MKTDKKHIVSLIKLIIKRLVYIVLTLILVLILISAAVRLPFVQQTIVNKVEQWGKKNINDSFQLKNLYINFPTTINLHHFYIEDQAKDTLLQFEDLNLDVNLFALLNKTIKVNNVRLYQAKANLVKSTSDSTFNFQYIIDRFSGDTTKQEQPENGWKFDVGGTECYNVQFRYNDSLLHSKIQVKVGKLDIDLDNLDLQNMTFNVNNFAIDSSYIEMYTNPDSINTMKTDNDTSSSTPVDVNIEDAEIKNTHIHLNNTYTKTQIESGMLTLQEGKFAMNEQLVLANSIKILNTTINHTTIKTDSSTQSSTSSSPNIAKPWTAKISSFIMENNAFKMTNKQVPRQNEGLDVNHLYVQKVGGDFNDISYKGDTIGGTIRSLSFKEHSGINLKSLQSVIRISPDNIDIDDLQLHVNQTKIAGSTNFYPAHFFNDSMHTKTSHVDIKEAVIHSEDILNAYPSLNDQIPDSLLLKLKTALSGNLSNLSIDHFTANLDRINLNLHGILEGLPDVKQTKMDIPELQLTATSKALTRILPDTVLPQNISLPDSIKLRAKLKGYWHRGENKIHLNSSFGNANIQSRYHLDTTTNNLQFDGKTVIQNFQLNQLLQNETLGKVDGQINFSNQGQSTDSTKIKIDGNINTFEYNQYAYENLEFQGLLRKTSFDGIMQMKSKELEFKYDGKVVFNDTTTLAAFTLNLNHANLQALNFTQGLYNVKGHLNSNVNLDTLGHINGNVTFQNINILKNDVFYKVDSIRFSAISNASNTEIKLQSDILSAQMSGNLDIVEIPNIISTHIDRYINENDGSQANESTYNKNRRLDFSLEFNDKELLTNVLVPGLNTFQISEFRGYYDEGNNKLFVKLDAPRVRYENNELDSLSLELISDNEKLRSRLNWSRLSNNIISVKDFNFQAQTQGDAINLSINIPQKNIDLLHLGGKLYQQDSAYYFSFSPDQIVFNGRHWQIPEDNHIGFAKGLTTKNILISRNNHEIALSTAVRNEDSLLNVHFKNFNLNNIGSALSIGDTLVGGVLNGHFQMITSAPGLALNTDINIDELSYLKQKVGRFALQSNYKNPHNKIKLSIDGDNNKLNITGNFKTGQQLEYELSSTIDKMDVQLAQPALQDNVDSLTGTLAGHFNIESSDASIPHIEGALQMNNIHVVPKYLNTTFKLEDEEINFKNNKISFEDFTIKDENDNNALLNGNIILDNFSAYKYELSAKTSNFKLFNTTSKHNDLYYGKMFLDSEIDIRGNEYKYYVDANVTISENSNFTYVVPVTETSVASHEGVVKFIDRDAKQNTFLQKYKEDDQAPDTTDLMLQGMELQANISVDENSKLSIIIDQETGDRLDLKGNADLNLSMSPVGDMRLFGRYEIVDGRYKLNFYQLAKREFRIVKGSSITWTGDPLEADLDVTTRYVVETTPPVARDMGRLPFYVNLNIGGEILKPDLSFNLSMPEEARKANANVYGVIQGYNAQENQLNKQVFSLIVFNSFMIDDSSGPSTTPIVSNAARTSLSKILTQQLNRLAGNINAVNLDVNLDSYSASSTGSESQAKTDLELGLSKSLFNNRLIVRVAGNVNVEGGEKQKQLSDYAGDILIEYKISESGELRLQGFKTEEIDGLTQGELTKTGAGIIFVKDYNSLKDLFNKKKKENGDK